MFPGWPTLTRTGDFGRALSLFVRARKDAAEWAIGGEVEEVEVHARVFHFVDRERRVAKVAPYARACAEAVCVGRHDTLVTTRWRVGQRLLPSLTREGLGWVGPPSSATIARIAVDTAYASSRTALFQNRTTRQPNASR